MYKPLSCLLTVKNKIKSLPNYENQAMWLCCSVLDMDSAHLLMNDMDISDEQYNYLMEKTNLLISGYPLQYITGDTQFMGLDFNVKENVLIPRNDTEIITELAIKHIGSKPLDVLDLCCGSGCIGLSIKYYCPNSSVTLADISSDALELTAQNAKHLGADVNIIKSDMFSSLSGAFDVIVSNPPYIPRAVIPTLSKQVNYEPKLALDGGNDGLDYYRKIKNDYRRFLKKGGIMLLETGHNQGGELIRIFDGGAVIKDYKGNDRILKLEKKYV